MRVSEYAPSVTVDESNVIQHSMIVMKLDTKIVVVTFRSVILFFWVFVACVFVPIASADDDSKPPNTDFHGSSPAVIQLHNLAANGSAAAQYELGLLYEYGRGVFQDDTIAAFWYEKSAVQLFSDAQYRLGILNDNGWGTPKNKQKALDLYKTAAEQGHPFAQHDLAIMYFKGTDAPKSLMQAYKWLKIAVVGGNPLMQKHLGRVAAEMSLDEIEVAEYLAEEWIERSGI